MKLADYKTSNLPDTPGVYFFLGPKKEILYIGKATSLKDRVRSYFSKDLEQQRSSAIVQMVEEAVSIDHQTTDSVLEALLLEASLIKAWQPHYNVMSKDDKSFNFVVITKEKFPRVLKVRSKELYDKFDEGEIKYIFGPFPHAGELNTALKLIRRIFPYFDTKKAIEKMNTKDKKAIELNRQIGLYPSFEDEKEYGETIKHIKLLFEGKKKQLMKSLEKQMKAYAKDTEFEKAGRVKRQVLALQHIQDVSLIKEESRMVTTGFRIEAYDVAHTSGKDTVGVMVVVEDGNLEKGGYRRFKISKDQNDDIGSLKEILSRRLEHTEWAYPKLIVVDGGVAHKRAAERVLKDAGFSIPVVAVVKDDKHKPKDILGKKEMVNAHDRSILNANAEAHRFAINFHRKRLRKGQQMLS